MKTEFLSAVSISGVLDKKTFCTPDIFNNASALSIDLSIFPEFDTIIILEFSSKFCPNDPQILRISE